MDNFFKINNDDFILDDYDKKSENKISPSHALTSEEVLSGWNEQAQSAQPTTSPLEAIKASGYLRENEITAAAKTLRAAALTYVAALAVSLANLLRLVLLVNGRNRRR